MWFSYYCLVIFLKNQYFWIFLLTENVSHEECNWTAVVLGEKAQPHFADSRSSNNSDGMQMSVLNQGLSLNLYVSVSLCTVS